MRSSVFAASRCRASSASTVAIVRGRRCFAGGPLGWARSARARAELFREEMHERMQEGPGFQSTAREHLHRCARLARRQAGGWRERWTCQVQAERKRTKERISEANRAFDSRVNAVVPAVKRQVMRQLKASKSTSAPVPVDTVSGVLIGFGAGAAMSGLATGIGAFLVVWGSGRIVSRFVVQRCDANDATGLCRWLPQSLRDRQEEIFERCKRELKVARALRAGDISYATHLDPKRTGAMNSEFDYTPERVFCDAMKGVASHPRVRDVLGTGVYAVAPPEKVVFKKIEGISEVYMAWNIAGSDGTAELQTKATASLLDYIYIFPDATGRYAMEGESFVIRPRGDWSKNTSEMPFYAKQPFGTRTSGHMYHGRTGVFEYDYTVGEFRHGREGGSWFNSGGKSQAGK